MPLPRSALVILCTGALATCAPRGPGCTGDYCGTVIIASVGEPESLLPPLAQSSVARDIGDQVFLKLADLGPTTSTIGDEGFTPMLAQRWAWHGTDALIFHLDPRARWHDGSPVTAGDVVFTYGAYTDPKVNSPFKSNLRWIRSVTASDSLTAVFRFQRAYPEMFYDAVYHMRILPAHLLRDVPRAEWQNAKFGRAPVGDGPYRFVSWKAGETVELAADSTFFLGRPYIRRLIWRITPDLGVAVTGLVAGENDATEMLVSPDNIKRASAAPQLATYPYKGTVYGYLGFNLTAREDRKKPHPLFGDPEVRRALAMAVDRQRLAESIFGQYAKVPPGPMSQMWWIWDLDTHSLPYDTLEAARILAKRGWVDSNKDGIRDRHGQTLSFGLLVPTSSAVRRGYARLIQEQLRPLGVEVRIDEVEFSVFMQRAQAGQFDALLQTWSTDPTPSSGIAQTWTRAGFGSSNYGRYGNPTFDRLVAAASSEVDRAAARRDWRAAMEIINHDAPAIFLFATTNVAAVHRRIENVTIRPDSWWASLRTWRIPATRLIDRDRVARGGGQ